jgi:hypothetical protein
MLKKNAIYLPYNALQAVIQPNLELAHISTLRAVGAVLLYLAAGWFIAWQLFLRRDAS